MGIAALHSTDSSETTFMFTNNTTAILSVLISDATAIPSVVVHLSFACPHVKVGIPVTIFDVGAYILCGDRPYKNIKVLTVIISVNCYIIKNLSARRPRSVFLLRYLGKVSLETNV